MVHNLSISEDPMKTPSLSSNLSKRRLRAAFTLTETVIAIGVLAVILTGFIAVFTPAAQGIRRSISSEQADRLTTMLENELATLRANSETPPPVPAFANSFDKAFKWIQEGNKPTNAIPIFVYQYRSDPTATPRTDGTPPPKVAITGEPGKDYIVQSMARRITDTELEKDLKALEGSVFYVKPTQLIFVGGELKSGTAGKIMNADTPATEAANATAYKEAVIAFTAEFHNVPTKSIAYLKSTTFTTRFNSTTNKPIFTRNLAVRR
jgi:type II secretory pathway pseudopilin PulG